MSKTVLAWPCLLLVLAALAAPSLATTTSAPITVPVYVPGYRAENWDNLAGSAITSVREILCEILL